MAVVGHAYVVVRAITDKVSEDIVKGFSGSKITNSTERAGRMMGNSIVRGLGRGMDGVDNKFTRLSKAFNSLYPEAEGLRRGFVRLNRAGMAVQSGVGALVGSIGALVGAAGALIGPLAGAAAGLVGVGSAAISAKIGLSVAQYALGGISEAVKAAGKQTGGYGESVDELREKLQQLRFDQDDAAISVDRAGFNLEKARQNMMRTADLAPNSLTRRDSELAFREAELAYRRAKDRQEDLKDGLKDTKSGGAADPFANLTPSQRAFAEYLLGIQDIFKDLKESAAAGFLPLLQEQIDRIIASGFFEMLEARYYDIGRAAGLAVEDFNDVFLSGDNFRDFNQVLKNTAEILPSFGTILGNIFGSVLSILTAADPLTRRFVGFLDSKTGSFAEFLDVQQARGDLEGFFDRAGDIGADFGAFFGGVFSGFGKIIQTNFGPGSPGDGLIKWLADVGKGFANKDLVGLDNYFEGAVDNFIKMAQTLGGAIETIVRAGSDPAVKAFWDTLDRGSFAFDKLVQNFVESGPSFGNVLRALTEVLSVLSDAGPVQAFMDTIAMALDGLAKFLREIEPLLKVIGPILAVVSALTLLGSLLSKVLLVFGSFLALIAKGTGSLALFSGAQRAAAVSTGAMTTAVAGNAAGQGVLAATTTATTGAVVANTAAIRANAAALLATPVGWIMAIVAAVAALALAMNSIDSANADKAVKEISNSLTSGEGSLLGASELAAHGLEKALYGVSDLGSAVDNFRKNQDMADAGFGWFQVETRSTKAFQKQLGSLSKALANLAVNDLKDAQAGFKRMRKEMGTLNDNEMKLVLNQMGDFKTALIDQADQLGINVRNIDGTIDSYKLMNFAMGEGEIAQRAHIEYLEFAQRKSEALRQAQVDLAKEFQQVSIQAGGFSDALKNAFDEIETEGENSSIFNPQKAVDNMRESIRTTIDYNKNLFALQGKGLSATSLDFIREQGALGPQIAAGLLAESDALLAEFNEGTAAAYVQGSDQFAGYLTDLEALAINNNIAPGIISGIKNDLLDATSQAELDTIGRRIASTIKNAASNATKVDPILLYFKGEMTALEAFRQSGYGKGNNNISGFVRNIDRFASGGFVSGPGGPRSDSIPAMLSNGEYVVNARSTSRHKNLLEKINSEGKRYANGGEVSGSPLSGSGINIVVNPSPGMDERELANAVSRRLAFEIRKGTI